MPVKSFIFLLVFLLQGLSLWCQQYNFRNYSVEDGVAQSQVYALIQDSRGLLWFGTQGGGLTSFDGIRFTTYSEKDGLSSSFINDIQEDSKGNLWIATSDGLCYFNGTTFKHFRLPEAHPVKVNKLSLDIQQQPWLATDEGLFLFTGKGFRNVSRELGISGQVSSVLSDREGNIWYSDTKGLNHLIRDGNALKGDPVTQPESLRFNAINCISQDSKGTIWIGTYNNGAYSYRNSQFTQLDLGSDLSSVSVYDIFHDGDRIWIGTRKNGVIIYQPSNGMYSQLQETEGLSNNHIRRIIRDNSGNYWLGTSGGGVCHYSGKQFTTYNKTNGLQDNYIYSIYRDSENRLWIGTKKGVSCLDNGNIAHIPTDISYGDLKIKAICESSNGTIFIGAEEKGVFILKDSVFVQFEPIRKSYVTAIIRDLDDQIWVATAGHGVYRLEFRDNDIHVHHISLNEGLLSDRLTSLWCDHKGRIWYGTRENGLGCISSSGKHLFRLSTTTGLSSNNIRSITEDQKGYLWIGTAGAGVNVISLDNPLKKPSHLDHKDKLSSSNIYLLVFDRSNLIIGTEKGLDYVWITDQNQVKNVKHYGKGEGFSGVETCQNAVFRDSDGTLWFGTINGLIRFQPSSLKKNTIPPYIRITDVRLFYKSLSETPYKKAIGAWNHIERIDLPYDQNHLTFEFFAVNLNNPEGVQYQWKLEGFDEKWSPASKERSILYSNLAPGTYRFLVKACNEDGVWTTDPAVILITIAPPFWYSWWFILSVSFFLLGTVFLLIRWRFNKLRKKTEEEKKKLQMEKEIVELEQKALRLQMNPHFIFNALNSIQSQIGTGNDKEARYYLAKFSRLMRQILDNSRSTTITLQEEINTLENYLLIEKFCNGDRFDYSITVPEGMETDFVKIPPMMVQPFVENAIKHGFRDIERLGRRGHIQIRFSEDQDCILCEITDNGIGREKSAELNKASKETYHRSTALLVTQERLDLLNENEEGSSLVITDLQKNGEASGTRVTIRIPIV